MGLNFSSTTHWPWALEQVTSLDFSELSSGDDDINL